MFPKFLSVIFVFTLACPVHAEQQSVVQDEYVEAFVKTINSEKVCYQDGSLKLYPTQSVKQSLIIDLMHN